MFVVFGRLYIAVTHVYLVKRHILLYKTPNMDMKLEFYVPRGTTMYKKDKLQYYWMEINAAEY